MLNKLNHTIPAFLLQPGYRVYRHLLVQLVVMLITINVFWDEPDVVLTERLNVWVVYFLLIDAIIYTNIYLLVPRLLQKGETLYYTLSVFGLLLLAILVLGQLQKMLPENNAQEVLPPVVQLLGALSSLAGFGILITGLTALLLFKNRLENAKRIRDLERSTMEIELANLQNQINPHFLFNMLNNANILAGEDAKKSSYLLARLNDLLHYQIMGSSKEMVSLKEDIDFLNDYLALEKTRRDRFSYSLRTEGDCNVNIPPLLFIPFVENAVKHNPENDSYVNLVFRISAERLYFQCENPKARSPYTKKDGGIGLVNIKKRLDLLFGKNYSLDLLDEQDKYTVIMEFIVPTNSFERGNVQELEG